MKFQKKKTHGSALIFAVIFAAIAGITVIAIARSIDFNARQSNYFERMNATYKLGETGLNDAVARLIRDPNIANFNTNEIFDLNYKGKYATSVSTRTFSINGGTPQKMFYLITSATSTVSGFSTRIHSYVKVSNVGDYFWAVKDRTQPSDGIDASTGRIYAPDIEFTIGGPAGQSKFLCAEYSVSVTPAADPNWHALYGGSVDISTNCTPDQSPKKVDPLVFPQVFQADLMNWQTKATVHKTKTKFGSSGVTTNIYPPGYNGPAMIAGYVPDVYALRTANNADHIYYSTGDIVLENVCVVGQVLFISSTNIYIRGDLTTAITGGVYPGVGPNASEANQAVLIAGQSVVISSYTEQFQSPFYPVPPLGHNPPWVNDPTRIQKIQALILTPNSRLVSQNYGVTSNGVTPAGNAIAYQTHLTLDFTGSVIAAGIAGVPNNIPNIFNSGALPATSPRIPRTYSYNPTFATHPPPYLPSISEIHYMFEERTNQKGLFNSETKKEEI